MRKTKAYAVSQIGIIGLPSVCYTPQQARKEAIACEREYMLTEDLTQTDQQIWKRMYRQGFRVVPVIIHHS